MADDSDSEPCPRDARCIKTKGHVGSCKHAKSQQRSSARESQKERAAHLAAMQQLGAKREQQAAARMEKSTKKSREGDAQSKGHDTAKASFQDFGLTKTERKAALSRGQIPKSLVTEYSSDEEGPEATARGSDGLDKECAAPQQAAALEELERIRLPRQRLEQWHQEPFFDFIARGCLVRIGIDPGGTPLYRVAEIVGVDEEAPPYRLGSQMTSKRLQLDFGESRQPCLLSVISNGKFDDLELRSWMQVREVFERPQLSKRQLALKVAALQQPRQAAYADPIFRRTLEQQQLDASRADPRRAQPKKDETPPVLTTRQKLAQQNTGNSSSKDANGEDGIVGLVARPFKFQRNVLGQAIVQQEE